LVTSLEFRKFVNSLNPRAIIPTRMTIAKIMHSEYELAIPAVQRKSQTAKGIIHLIFDGWTSRQNASFLGINAYCIDTDWNHQVVFLGLPLLKRRYTSEVIYEKVATILRFFLVLKTGELPGPSPPQKSTSKNVRFGLALAPFQGVRGDVAAAVAHSSLLLEFFENSIRIG
jgi:hypothetical protein